MNQQCHRFLLTLLLSSTLWTCATTSVEYTQVRISDKYFVGQSIGTPDHYSRSSSKKGQWRRFYKKKHLVTLPNKTTSAKILNKSVEYIKSGEYREAEILLKQIEHEEKAEIFNNLAVLYEITGKRESALKYYHKACTLDKGNHLYRENFNTLQ